jgi:hypothetical protein
MLTDSDILRFSASKRTSNAIAQVLTFTCAFFIAAPAFATVYGFHPSSTLHLGAGFDPNSPDRGYLPCIDYDGAEHLENDNSAGRTEFVLTVVHNRKELYQHLHIDANISARSFFASGSASFSLDTQYTFGSNDLVWILKASSDYGRWVMRNPRLNREAYKLRRQVSAFRERCGSEFVAQERRIAEVTAVYEVHDLTESQQSSLNAAISGQATLGAMSGNLDASYSQFLKSAEEAHKLTVDIYGAGGQGVTLLAPIASMYDLPTVSTTLKTYIEHMPASQATPVEFVTGSSRSFGVAVELFFVAYQNEVLSELYFSYLDNDDKLKRLGDLIRRRYGSRSVPTPVESTNYAKSYQDIGKSLKDINDAGKACLKNEKDCSLVPLHEISIQWPDPQYETRWESQDQSGHDYYVEYNLWSLDQNYRGAIEQTGSYSLNNLAARIRSVQFVPGPEVGCQFDYVPDGGRPPIEVAADQKSFTWRRKWGGSPCHETYRVFYELPVRVCTRDCN